MTKHRPKPVTLTPELVERFAAYHKREPVWGVLHVQLDDCNYGLDAEIWREATDEERELVRLWNLMSRSQRVRLAKRCGGLTSAGVATLPMVRPPRL